MLYLMVFIFFFFKQKTAYEMRISDWSSDVCSSDLIEIVPELGRRAAEDLKDDFPNVETRIGDGYAGWPEAAPFDRIMVTAAAPYIPRPLVEQLAPGGRMVIPVGPEASVQRSEEHTSELQSLMRISYAVFCLKKKSQNT